MADVAAGVGGGEVAVVAPNTVELDRFGHPVDLLEVLDLSVEQRTAFVDYVRDHKGCSVKEACEAVGVRRRDVRALRKSDSEFAEDYAAARGYGAEQILGGMVKLGIEGVEEPLVSAGKLVRDDDGKIMTVRRYDSRALIQLFNGMTEEGKSLAAGKLGIEVNVSGVNSGPVQAGVPLSEVAKVLLEAGVDLQAIAAGPGEIEGEIVADDPA